MGGIFERRLKGCVSCFRFKKWYRGPGYTRLSGETDSEWSEVGGLE